MPLVASMAAHTGDRHATDAELAQNCFDGPESRWLDDCFQSGHLLGLLRGGKMDDCQRACRVPVYRGGSSWSDCVVDTTLCPTESER